MLPGSALVHISKLQVILEMKLMHKRLQIFALTKRLHVLATANVHACYTDSKAHQSIS